MKRIQASEGGGAAVVSGMRRPEKREGATGGVWSLHKTRWLSVTCEEAAPLDLSFSLVPSVHSLYHSFLSQLSSWCG